MRCPPEVAEILFDLLRIGIIRARAAGWDGDAGRCAIETDHIHNIPDLIEDFRAQRLDYYWKAERACYIDRIPDGPPWVWGPLWDQLRPHAEAAGGRDPGDRPDGFDHSDLDPQ